MVALRGLSWPHLVPINRSQTSQSCQSTPTSPVTKPSSVQDLILQIEAAQESHLRSSDGDRSRTPTFRSFAPNCTELQSRIPSQALTGKEIRLRKPSHREPTPMAAAKESAIISQTFSQVEEEGIFRAYANLPAPPEESGDDIGFDFNPHFPPSPIAYAVDSAGDNLRDLPNLPDSPLALSKFGLLSRESFDTAMRDLIQEEPDAPIGGHKAAPMKRSFNVGTLAIQGKSRDFLETPRIEISSPKRAECCEYGNTKPLKDRSNFSDPFHEVVMAEHQSPRPATPGSDSSVKMVTAPASPRVDRLSNRSDHSDLSYDELGLEATDVRDFGLAPESPISPCSQVIASTISDAPMADADITSNNLDGSPVPSYATGVDEAQAVAEIPNTDGAAMSLPSPRKSTPSPPEIRKKRRKFMSNGKKLIRRSRTIIMCKPVLTVVLGRQLAGPTYQGLKVLAMGLSLDATAVKRASPLPGSLPVPTEAPCSC
jgi:hypothetical protein